MSMTQGLAKYHARSPRYTLNTEDDSLIRISGPSQIPWEEGTEIRDVSLTGLSFTAPEDLCPILGEVIRIQFTIPGSQQMACYGIVTRLELEKSGNMLVGAHFYKLEMPQRIVLAQGLTKKFKSISAGELSTQNQFIDTFKKIPQLVFMSLLVCFWSWTLVALIKYGPSDLLKVIMYYMTNR